MLAPNLYTWPRTWPSTNIWLVPTTASTTLTSLPPGWWQPTMSTAEIFNVTSTYYYHTITPSYRSSWGGLIPAERRAAPRRPPVVINPEAALERSLSLFRRLRPEQELQRFLAGDPIRVRGHRFDYHVKKTMDPLSHTRQPHSPHIPYDLRIVTKEGKILAKGCIIVPGTPLIDQLLAFILNVGDAREEEKVVRLTNWDTNPPELQLAA